MRTVRKNSETLRHEHNTRIESDLTFFSGFILVTVFLLSPLLPTAFMPLSCALPLMKALGNIGIDTTKLPAAKASTPPYATKAGIANAPDVPILAAPRTEAPT